MSHMLYANSKDVHDKTFHYVLYKNTVQPV